MINIKIYDLNNIKYMEPNGHIFVYSQSIRRRKSVWKVHQKEIDFERRTHVETMSSIRRGNFDVDSTFKIVEISIVLPVDFSTLFRCQIDITSVRAVSTDSFPNIFCSGKVF